MKPPITVFIAVLLSSLWTQSASAEFESDMDAAQILKQIGKTLVNDLLIGEKALVKQWNFCRDDNGQVYINEYAQIVEEDGYSYSVVVKILKGRRVDVSFKTGTSGDPKNILEAAYEILNRGTCQSYQKLTGAPNYGGLFLVESIHGHSMTSEIPADLMTTNKPVFGE